MKLKRGLGILLIFIGIAVILSNTAITGSVIGLKYQNYIVFLGGLIFILGILIILTTTNSWNKYKIGLVVEEYDSGTLNPIQAAVKINEKLFPNGIKVTGIDYRGGKKETIRTKERYFPVELSDERKARDLALALYEIALINDRNNSRNCELHLGKGASSKHHRQGLQKIIESFEQRNKRDLDSARLNLR